ncbi:MAG: D-2-hydroxyacid dehydrogenase [Caldilineaceae bacterium]
MGDFRAQLVESRRESALDAAVGAGADWLMRHPEAEMDFVLTNASGVHAIPITEHIFAFLFGLARNFQGAIRDQVAHRWHQIQHARSVRAAGEDDAAGGGGRHRQQTARVAAALDMTVIGVRRDPSVPAAGVTRMIGADHLLDALPEADFVVVTAPLTRETAGMFGEREFRAMKPSSHFINIGRGGTVVQSALVRALQEGWIAGAGLDVVDPEPLPTDSPLWDMPNVILTSHYSGLTPHYDDRALAIFLDNLRRYQAGETMRNVVDKAVGY